MSAEGQPQKILPFGEKSYNFIHTSPKDDARITILSGAVRSSKTFACMIKLLTLCGDDSPKGGIGLITGASKDSIYDNVLRDLFEVLVENFGPDSYHYNAQSGNLRLFDDNWKIMGAKDEGSDKYLLGKTIAKAYADEVSIMPERFFRQLINRMSPDNARLYCTTNPDSPHHYLYRDFINNDEINEKGLGLVRTIHFTLEDNPTLSEEYKASIRAMHSGVFYSRYVDGLWVMAEGVIYRDSWNETENTFDDEDIPKFLLNNFEGRYIGVDYGTTNPMVFLDCYDDSKTIWVMKEYWWDSVKKQKQLTDAQYADELVTFIGDKQDAELIIDPSAASFKAECRGRGLLVVDAKNEVMDGIRCTSSAIQKRIVRVHRRNCPNLLREVVLYAWDPAAAKRGKEEPLKQNDHGMDGLRYVCKTKLPWWRLSLLSSVIVGVVGLS